MIIDWTQAPKGTTHCTINGGEPRWYQETLGGMNCWNVANATWFQSFFSSPSDIEDNGLRLYALGEQTELVMLREQRDALLEALKFAKHALEDCYDVREWPANGESTCDHAILAAEKAIALVEGTK